MNGESSERERNKTKKRRYRYKKEKMSHEKKIVLGIIFGVLFVTVVFWGTSILGSSQLFKDSGTEETDSNVSQSQENSQITEETQGESSEATEETETETDENPSVTSDTDGQDSDGLRDDDLPNQSYQVPQSPEVDNSYFDDAVFMGDSRTEGFALYTGLSNITCFASRGLNVDTVFTEPVINLNGSSVTAVEALKNTSFSKLYLMFGINETGWLYESYFIDGYGDIIDAAKQTNPNAVIYIQSILPVSKTVSDSNGSVNMERINYYNSLLRQLAEEKGVYFVNCGEAMTNSEGYLPEDAATDGIHLGVEYCEIWLDYLKTHTVSSQ